MQNRNDVDRYISVTIGDLISGSGSEMKFENFVDINEAVDFAEIAARTFKCFGFVGKEGIGELKDVPITIKAIYNMSREEDYD